MSQFIVDITPENAQAILLEESYKRPVLVDFWADWCGPCKSIAPILESLANEYAGEFVLAKVNADELGQLAGQFGVQSLPTMIIMKDGQPADALSGAQSEQDLRAFVSKHLPAAWEKDLVEVQGLMQAGDFEGALVKLRKAYKDSGENVHVRLMLVSVLIELKRYDEASTLLAEVRMKDQGPEYEQLKARLDLEQNAEKAPEVQALEAKLSEDDTNDDVRMQLAAQYTAEKHYKDALELLLSRLKQDINAHDGEVKKEFINIIQVLGATDPIAKSYQGKLYSLLY